MNTPLRTSLVALLALIPILVMTGCGTSTPVVANPAGTTASTTTSGPSPTVPNTVPNPAPNSFGTIQPPAESSTSAESTEPSSEEPSSEEPSSEEPSTEEPTSQEEPTAPAVPPTDLSGEVYGYIRGVDAHQSQLTLDKIDWFSGAEAEQACAEDAVPQEEYLNGWCSMYYFRNVNPKLRVLSVSPGAVITTLDGNIQVSGTLTTLADESATELGLYHPYRLVVADDAIVELTEIYQP